MRQESCLEKDIIHVCVSGYEEDGLKIITGVKTTEAVLRITEDRHRMAKYSAHF